MSCNGLILQPITNIYLNRVCEILEHTNVDDWNRVASSDNPADAAIRCI